MCTESIVAWHYGKSWHEDIEFRYSEVVKGKSIQLCPLWGKFMEKSKKWNHLTWQRCMSNFCLFCRNKFTKHHLNPLNAQMWSSLQKAQKESLVSKMPSVSTSLWKRLILLVVLLLISPIFWLILLPYVWIKNINNIPSNHPKLKRKTKWRRYCLSTISGVFLPLMFPITFIFWVILIFITYFKISKKGKRSSVYAKKSRFDELADEA